MYGQRLDRTYNSDAKNDKEMNNFIILFTMDSNYILFLVKSKEYLHMFTLYLINNYMEWNYTQPVEHFTLNLYITLDKFRITPILRCEELHCLHIGNILGIYYPIRDRYEKDNKQEKLKYKSLGELMV